MTINITAFANSNPELSTENGKIIVNNAAENGTLIAAFYKSGVLIGVKTYKGGSKIEFDVKSEMTGDLAGATDLKAFFWDMETIKPLCNLLPLQLRTAEPAPTPIPTENDTETGLKIRIGDKLFTAALENNETANALKAMLPMTINMSELNGNEKYYNLPQNLPTNTQSVKTIQAGDIMLWGSNCIVIFYETFNTSYSYTRIGHIDDVTELKAALGTGSITVTIE